MSRSQTHLSILVPQGESQKTKQGQKYEFLETDGFINCGMGMKCEYLERNVQGDTKNRNF